MKDSGEAILGSFDGATSLVGLLAGALLVHAPPHVVLVEAAALAVAAAVSMAGGTYLAAKGVTASLVMGVASLVGSLLPALPVVLLPGPAGVGLAALLMLCLGVGIAEVRCRTTERIGRRLAYCSTFLVLLVASGLAVAVSLLLGVSG